MYCSKRTMFNFVIAFNIIIIVIGYLKGHLALTDTKIWKNGSPTLKPLHNTTIVAAFFDIGPVKRMNHKTRNQTIYFKWAKTFRYMRNTLVVYTDSEPFRKHITAVRRDLLSITEIFMVNRSLLWSFQNLENITKIYNSKSYPKHYPDYSPLYTCVTHAKFDLLSNATRENIFKTKYFMWLDIGYFKHRESRNMFHMTKPKGFNDLKIAVNQVRDMDKYVSPARIVKSSRRSIGCGVIYGERACVMMFVEDFKRAVRYFLSKNIMSSEEPVVCAMFSKKGKQILKPTSDLQLYRKGKQDWYYLGNSMIKEENVTHVKGMFEM